MNGLKTPRWDGLALRFSVLLAVALVAALLIAAAILYVDRARQTTAHLIEREVERIVSLVPAIEAAPLAPRRMVARVASTRFARGCLERHPRVDERPVAIDGLPILLAEAELERAVLPELADPERVVAGRGDVEAVGGGEGVLPGLVYAAEPRPAGKDREVAAGAGREGRAAGHVGREGRFAFPPKIARVGLGRSVSKKPRMNTDGHG